MDGLDDAFAGEHHSPGTYVGAAVFVVGLVLVGIGALSVLMDAFAGALAWELAVGVALAAAGGTVTGVLTVAVLVLHDGGLDRRGRAGLGVSALGVVLVLPAWVASPGVIGTAGLGLAGLCFLIGSLVLVGVAFEGAIATDLPGASNHASFVRDSNAGGTAPGVADGGSDDDLEFLLDDERD